MCEKNSPPSGRGKGEGLRRLNIFLFREVASTFLSTVSDLIVNYMVDATFKYKHLISRQAPPLTPPKGRGILSKTIVRTLSQKIDPAIYE